MIEIARFALHYCAFRMIRARYRYDSEKRWHWMYTYILMQNRSALEQMQKRWEPMQ